MFSNEFSNLKNMYGAVQYRYRYGTAPNLNDKILKKKIQLFYGNVRTVHTIELKNHDCFFPNNK